eukprot:m.267376 g.267376  ORF g.267376 m.267376 type:complete len:119 (+) comp40512_c0_seq14:100-456(+)
MSVKLKILVIGPAESGKTFISNFLVDDVEPTGKYRPTTGVRIVEVKNQSNADVELWDCSGSKQYESCWPALWKDAHGAMLVTTPQKTSEIKTWYMHECDELLQVDYYRSQCCLLKVVR